MTADNYGCTGTHDQIVFTKKDITTYMDMLAINAQIVGDIYIFSAAI